MKKLIMNICIKILEWLKIDFSLIIEKLKEKENDEDAGKEK